MLKPAEMRAGKRWPPPRQQLRRVTLRLISLHQLPTRGEHRPQLYYGQHAECHAHVSELSGRAVQPKAATASTPSLAVELHPIDGYCCVTPSLPHSEHAPRSYTTNEVRARHVRFLEVE